MMPADMKNITTRKNMRSLKSKEPSVPRRQSLAPSVKLSGQQDDNNKKKMISALPRLLKTVRKSIAPAEQLRFRTDAERAAHEAYDHVIENYPTHNRSAMKFEADVDKFPALLTYWKQADLVDLDMMHIGGMIRMHQYCYKEFKKTGDPVLRDAANFFKVTDPNCIFGSNIYPIHMVYLGIFKCDQVESWYRDYYCHRDYASKNNIRSEFDEDKTTKYDLIFDNLGREAVEVLVTEMKLLEDYCQEKFENDELPIYKKGAEFWKKASPMHLPRNYQLALILKNQEKWEDQIVEEWFRMLYEERSCRGARGKDVFN
ncbi:hypothetical protein GCK72_024574 [Caenorhabditis remanei]|uniref:Uncharacterized protein n=1 Tax=Caenorhabditis remanei TaxID=31234 RepID=A0A6A5FZN1_CAERE|nr:hypothetical protein GCK72_024574 [Caenorhabditis remanei]KAF1748107.1 hypothetical protein GCK72_024574 [Caenorhabditis remanei]